MATETCPSCGGSGYNSMSGVMPGSQNGAPPCTQCKGSGYVRKSSSNGTQTDCFPGDTLVLTPVGYRQMAELVDGDEVLSLAQSGGIVSVIIKRKISHSAHPILKVVSEIDELSFFATKRHPVQTHRGWIRIKNLKNGDAIFHVDKDGNLIWHLVVSVVKTERFEPVYNIVVDGNHSYLVNGCVAHSFVYFRRARTIIFAVLSSVRKIWSPKKNCLENWLSVKQGVLVKKTSNKCVNSGQPMLLSKATQLWVAGYACAP